MLILMWMNCVFLVFIHSNLKLLQKQYFYLEVTDCWNLWNYLLKDVAQVCGLTWFKPFRTGSVFICQNLTSVDVRF